MLVGLKVQRFGLPKALISNHSWQLQYNPSGGNSDSDGGRVKKSYTALKTGRNAGRPTGRSAVRSTGRPARKSRRANSESEEESEASDADSDVSYKSCTAIFQ